MALSEAEWSRIERVLMLLERFGFPSIAFFLMWWMANSTIAKNTEAIANLSLILAGFR